jgi:uroporphyrinogen-III decarboxylase
VRRRFATPAGELTDLRMLPDRTLGIGFDHVVEPPAKDRADLERLFFLLPDPARAEVHDLPAMQALLGDEGVVACRPTRGTDQFLVDAVGVESSLLLYYDDRPFLVELLRRFNAYTQAVMRRALEAGVLMIFDPWYNCGLSVGWSLAQWRELFLPHIRANAALTHDYGAIYSYYDDGKMAATLEDLADAGVDVVETLTPPPMGDVDLAAAKRRVGGRLCLKGSVDQVHVILPGPPERIWEAVRRAVEIGAPGGGFILGTADSIRPETPPAHADAYFAAAREFAAAY